MAKVVTAELDDEPQNAPPGALNMRRDEESKPKRRHRATGKPRGGARPGAGRKPTGKQAIIEEMVRRKGVSIRTAQRLMRVHDYSRTLAGLVNASYIQARETGLKRGPLTWAWADRHVRKVLRWSRQGLSVEEIAAKHEASPGEADIYEKVAREIVASARSNARSREMSGT